MSDETVDLSKLDEAALRAKHAETVGAIATLEGQPPTLETGRAIRALKLERNAIAERVNELVALAADEVPETPIVDTDASATIGDALADASAEDEPKAEADVEAPAVDAPAAEGDAPAPKTETEPPATPAVEPVAEAPEAPAAEAATEAPVTPEAPATSAEEPPAPVAEAPQEGRETATPEDVPVPTSNGGTPVAEATPDPEVEGVIAEAEAIANQAASQPPLSTLAAVTASLAAASGTAVLDRPTVGYQAGGGQTTFSQGVDLSFDQIGQVIREIQTSGRDRGDGVIAHLPAFEATPGMVHEVLTTRLSAIDATALINETVEAHKLARKAKEEGIPLDAVTAAICTPLDIIRDVPECGVTATPFTDIFPQRGVGRLGFQYFPQMALIDTDPNVNVWNEDDNQSLVDEADPSTWKPSPLIECLPAVSVTAEELVASAQVDNSTQLSQPEQVVQFMHKLAVQRARRKEQYLMGKFDATASGYTLTADYGAMVGLLSTGELLERLVYGERLDEGDYDLVLEPGHFRKLLLDEDARVFGDTLASRKAGVIAKIKDELGVGNVVILRDFRTGGGYDALNDPGDAATAMPRLYDANRVRYVPTSAYIFGSSGEDSTGWETDPQLTRQNRMQWFSKEWLLLAKHGCHPAAYIDLTSCASGARANGIEPVDCVGDLVS